VIEDTTRIFRLGLWPAPRSPLHSLNQDAPQLTGPDPTDRNHTAPPRDYLNPLSVVSTASFRLRLPGVPNC
jgi:hypothetical protein